MSRTPGHRIVQPSFPAPASRSEHTFVEWWTTTRMNDSEEDLLVLLRRPKRNAKPKPLLIPLKALDSVKNNEKRHIDDSSDVANEPVLLTRDLSHLDSSVLSSSLNSKRNQKEEDFNENSYTHSLMLPAEITLTAMAEHPREINREEFSINVSCTDLSECQSTNQKLEEEMVDHTQTKMNHNSSIKAEASVEKFEQIVASSVNVGQSVEIEPRNLSQEQKFRDIDIITASSEDDSSVGVSNKELSDSVASLINAAFTNNVFDYPSINSDRGEQSVLRRLVQGSVLTHLKGNASHKPESHLVSESPGEISSNSSSVVLHQLADIKQLLQTHATEKNEIFISNLDYKYKNFAEKTTSALELLKMKSEASADSIKEKIALILENLSTLKMMIFGQEHRIIINDNRIDQFQALLNERNSCVRNRSTSDAQDAIKQVIVNVTSLDDYFSGISLIDFNITKLTKRLPQIVNNTFEDIYEKIGKLEKTIASYDSKLDRYFLKRIEVAKKEDINLSEVNSRCQCNESRLQTEVNSLKERITALSSSLDLLKTNNKLGSVKSPIHEESVKFDLLDSPETDMVTAESSVNNFTREVNANNEMASKVRLMENKLVVLETELMNMRDLRDEVTFLKRQLEQVHPINGSSEVLCVWPYKPHGGHCYHVSTDERHNWGSARARCRELQGDLAAPHDYEAFKKFIQTQRLSRSYSFWIGASDSKEAGRWVWVTGEPVPGYVWATGHPNLMRSDRCMEIRPDLRLAAAGEACRVSNYFVCQQRGT
ncbi:C-type lectin-like [Trinorchestia longiramus]|nr:C-type lectin-like [Trinorchestia longiramus]